MIGQAINRGWSLFTVLILASATARAQPEAELSSAPRGLQPGHSVHGEVFNKGPRQRAFLIGATGKVSFLVSTSNQEAQNFFTQGVGQLHGFWYFEAERSFRQVAALDPDCAMAYWGMAMANIDNTTRAKEFIKEAAQRKETASKREQMWIEGLEKYLADEPKDQKKRRREYLRSLENIIHEYPDDLEAKAFLCVRLWQFKKDLPLPSYVAVNALLTQIFDSEPMHPAHHYRIHLWDRERPDVALAAAARCGQAAPRIAHMWHMPGHIFSRLKRYSDAAWQQEASARVDHAQMMRDRILPDQIHNYAHNNEWLIRNLSHIGRVHDAVDLAKNMIELPRHPKYNTLQKSGRSASYGRKRLYDVLERYELWKEMEACLHGGYLEPIENWQAQLKRTRAIGMAAWGTNNRNELVSQITLLKENITEEKAKRVNSRREARKKAREQNKTEAEIYKAGDDARRPHSNRISDQRNTLKELRGYRDLMTERGAVAFKRFEEVNGLSKAHLARLAALAGNLDRAEEIALEVVNQDDKSVTPLANYADILYQAGKTKEAEKSFEKLRALSAHLDLDVPVMKRLEPLAMKLGYSEADWRIATIESEDTGERPSLDSLGPFHWTPTSAPSWELPRADGKLISLKDYRGKPVVVIFYLGHGCLHCVQQLKTFSPKASKFTEEGISIIAIGTDDRNALANSLNAFKDDGESPPFPLLSDTSLEVFKSYRAYDDFEDQPLHGTFLIDGAGLVRWQDISYEPFNNPDFILNEAKRLTRQISKHGVVLKSPSTKGDLGS